jgi:ribosomal protein S18 acetylase RimI-like enzyme
MGFLWVFSKKFKGSYMSRRLCLCDVDTNVRIRRMYSLRTPTEDDYNICKAIGHEGLKPYIHELIGWNQENEDAGFSTHWDLSSIKIILHQLDIAGYFKLEDMGKHLKIDGIYIAAANRNLGLGKIVIEDILQSSNVPVRLQVYKINPAHKLYRRLGFKVIRVCSLRYYMEHKA